MEVPGECGSAGLIKGIPRSRPRSISNTPIKEIKRGTSFFRFILCRKLISVPAYPTSIMAGKVPRPNIAIKPTLSLNSLKESVAASAIYNMPHGKRPLAIPNNKKLVTPAEDLKTLVMSL